MNIVIDVPSAAPDEFAGLPDGGRGYELIDGVPVEKHVGNEASWVGGVLLTELHVFLRANRIGWAFPPDTAFRCFPGRPRHVRKPDAAFVRAGRLPGEWPARGNGTVAPDWVAEVISPNDTYYEVEEKVAEYRSAGVRLIWVVCPPTRTVLVRRLDGSSAEVGPDGTLDGEDVIPGFRCPVAALFEPTVPRPANPT